MNLNYKIAQSTICPQAFEISQTTVYLRKNFQQVQNSGSEGQTFKYWEYLEAQLSIEDFNKNANSILLNEQLMTYSTQLDIMEGIADLSMIAIGGAV